MHEKVETFSKFAIHKEFELIRTLHAPSFSEDELQQTMSATKFSSTAGFDNEMKSKSRLLPFSLIHIWCLCAFCFRFQ